MQQHERDRHTLPRSKLYDRYRACWSDLKFYEFIAYSSTERDKMRGLFHFPQALVDSLDNARWFARKKATKTENLNLRKDHMIGYLFEKIASLLIGPEHSCEGSFGFEPFLGLFPARERTWTEEELFDNECRVAVLMADIARLREQMVSAGVRTSPTKRAKTKRR